MKRSIGLIAFAFAASVLVPSILASSASAQSTDQSGFDFNLAKTPRWVGTPGIPSVAI